MRLPALRVRSKVLLIVGGIVAFSALVSTVLIETNARILLREQVLASATRQAQHLAVEASEPILTDRTFELRELVDNFLTAYPEARYAFIVGPNGDVLASSFGAGVPEDILAANRPVGGGAERIQPLETEEGLIYDIAVWVLEGGAGMVRLGIADRAFLGVTEEATRITLLVQVGALLAALALAFVLADVLLLPLRRLGVATRRVARGELDHEVTVHSRDELGELGEAFNHMLAELRSLHEQLVQARDDAADIARSLADALIVVGPHGRVQAINPSTERVAGMDEAALVGQPIDEVLVSETKGQPLSELLSRDGVTSSYDLRIRTADGGSKPVSFRSAPVRGRDGRHKGFVITLRDLGQLRMALDRMKEERADLERRQAALKRVADYRAHEVEQIKTHLVRSDRLVSLGQLAAGLAHEINNPLASILTYAKVLEREVRDAVAEPNPRMTKSIDVIASEIKRCASIVRRFLDYSRAGQGESTPLCVDEILDEVAALVGAQARVEKIALEREDEVRPLSCRGDANQLRQVFLNIIINAIQATPAGGSVTVSSGYAKWIDGEGRGVEIRVTDTGCGIPEDHLAKVFDPFFTTKKRGQGTGLGLAVAQEIISGHGGTIEAKAAPGGGTEVVIRLPCGGKEESNARARSTADRR